MLRTLCCLALAGVLSLSVFGGAAQAQGPAFKQSAPQVQPQYTALTEQSVSQLLQQAGLPYQVLQSNGHIGWKVNNPLNPVGGPAIELGLKKNAQGQVTG